MGTPDMRVDEGALGWDPAEVTVPSVPIPPAGSDALSKKINEVMPGVAAAVTEHVKETRVREERFAANLASARSAYHGTDGAEQQRIEAASRQMTDSRMTGVVDSRSGGGALSGAAGSEKLGGQFGQLVTMAMQAGAQAAQVPMQGAGIVGQIPQAVTQGIQGLTQETGLSSDKKDGGSKGSVSSVSAADSVLSVDQEELDGDKQAEDRTSDDSHEEKEGFRGGAAVGSGQRAPVESSPSPSGPELGRHLRMTEVPPEVSL